MQLFLRDQLNTEIWKPVLKHMGSKRLYPLKDANITTFIRLLPLLTVIWPTFESH